MQYRLLSKEQFEALHQEFATFLAVQEIDKKEWEIIKAHNPDRVDQLLENFSDMVWEDVLKKTRFLEHFSKDSINLFECGDTQLSRIVIRVEGESIDLQSKEGFNWFLDHSNYPNIHYFKGKKEYTPNRNNEIFKLIEQGAVLSDGKLYQAVLTTIQKTSPSN